VNPAFKKMFVEALRSNKYKQGTGKLCESVPSELGCRFCVLGVGLDLIMEELKEEWYPVHYCRELDPTKQKITYSAASSPADPVSTSFHIRRHHRELMGINEEETRKLMMMNDRQKLPFTQIADYVEQNM
jgi:hypothetical protein